MSIEVRDITKRFGAFTAVDDVSLQVEEGELVGLLGPSGSGKTTVLRIIAGLERPDQGSVWLDGVDVSRETVARRGVGFVFQHYALFRHLTVFENVAFGLRVRPRAQRPSDRRRSRSASRRCWSWCNSTSSRTVCRHNSQADSGSAWRLRGRSPWSRGSCCSTSRSARWMPPCAGSCGAGCGGCTTSCTSPVCS